ncbi:hypothetical protein LF1_27800 [Rubripirellula obstinata]|uniref:Sulfatase n=1 Tax=Rubripirellula obstinata TaxID=406547 RepID=A0A5B1CJ14_9BACT|nr:DUF1501 domain-containing protein [Rubripirellula obstinata]KAA1260241.1 hypothetical protein LF1_27800 [Rubripirellula obstinata]
MHRRSIFQAAATGVCTVTASGWMPAFADRVAEDPNRRRHCIVLWMGGGPSQLDTFDPKPNHENGGEFGEIVTNVPGIRISEHLPQLAKQADKLAIVRSLSTKEGDHTRGTHLMQTGQTPMGAIDYPSMGSVLARELGDTKDALPNFISVGQGQLFSDSSTGSGFLGPRYSPLRVTGSGGQFQRPGNDSNQDSSRNFASLNVPGLRPPAGVETDRMARRLDLLKSHQASFVGQHVSPAALAHQTVYEGAVQLMNGDSASAFDLSKEPKKLRQDYGGGVFGQGCLLARRLVEHGAAFVEVNLDSSTTASVGWDTHSNIFESVKSLSQELDSGWATLMRDLEDRGLLESTTILWMGEFGRTPNINSQGGRDHFPQAWTCVLGGGGIAGGQAYGRTSADGVHVEENKCGVGNVLATLCSALGVDPATQHETNTGRPVAIVDADPIDDLLA